MHEPTPTEPSNGAPRATGGSAAGLTGMRAVVQDRYSADIDEALRLDTIPLPSIGAKEVLVEVRAAAVDRGTLHLMSGVPHAARLAFGLRRPRNRVPGRDLAGVVVAVGGAVERLTPGDEVFGTGEGSLAEFARAAERRLAPLPHRLDFAAAAAVPVSGLTALQACDAGRVGPGQRVAIVGASGGVGTFAVQIAAALGAEVTGICSAANADLVRSLGAAHVLDHQATNVDDGAPAYDVILDIAGNTPISRLRRATGPRGTVVLIGGTVGRWLGVGRQLRAAAMSPIVRQRLVMLVSRERADDLERLGELIDGGAVAPVVERTWSLDHAPAALEHLAAGRARGKLVVSARAGDDPLDAPSSGADDPGTRDDPGT